MKLKIFSIVHSYREIIVTSESHKDNLIVTLCRNYNEIKNIHDLIMEELTLNNQFNL